MMIDRIRRLIWGIKLICNTFWLLFCNRHFQYWQFQYYYILVLKQYQSGYFLKFQHEPVRDIKDIVIYWSDLPSSILVVKFWKGVWLHRNGYSRFRDRNKESRRFFSIRFIRFCLNLDVRQYNIVCQNVPIKNYSICVVGYYKSVQGVNTTLGRQMHLQWVLGKKVSGFRAVFR